MNTPEEQILQKSETYAEPNNNNDREHTGNRNTASIYPIATSTGLAAGMLMGVYLLALQMIGLDHSIVLKFLKYLFLAGMLGWALYRYRKQNTDRSYLQSAILLGLVATVISALTLIVTGLAVSFVQPEWAFNRFSLPVDTTGNLLVTSGAIFFEVLVFGLLSTFIWLQYFKRSMAD